MTQLQKRILLTLSDETTIALLAQRLKRSPGAVGTAMYGLKDLGKVDNRVEGISVLWKVT